MIKKDISKILTEGSAKQKLLIIAEDEARKTFIFQHPDLKDREPLLTDKEYRAVSDSFKTDREIALWNKWVNHKMTVVNALGNLQGLMFEVKTHYSNLRGYVLLWNAIENSELLANSILHEIKDPQERKRIAKDSAGRVKYLFSETAPDEEGYIEIDINHISKKKDYHGLRDLIENVSNQVRESAIKLLSWKKAIQDYIEETGFNVPTYKDMIKVVTKEIYTPPIDWTKYKAGDPQFRGAEDNKRVNNIKSKYAIIPDIKSLEPDEEIVRYFKDNFLKDE